MRVGGCGKTTMATLLFNRLRPAFRHTTFIQLQPDERIGSQHLSSVLSQLGATAFNRDSPTIRLLEVLQKYIHDRTVLIVVDNVWVKGHLDELLPREFGPGSRVIITSRSSSLPDSDWWSQAHPHLQYHHMDGLVGKAAKQLFRTSASMDVDFQMPCKDLCDAEQALVDACKGLPLALKLSGALLRCNQRNEMRPLNEWKLYKSPLGLQYIMAQSHPNSWCLTSNPPNQLVSHRAGCKA
eukprot:GHUV01021182.1.p1 GENE.GHUV01021182.1~~GHUV01021182.1.p1  ORF type:complete len:239 (+),score=40.16 GHUV01021182.1:493-1209(+)